jgi:hypothetical protein
MVRGIDGTLVALPEQGVMDYHKNAASCHSVNGYLAPKNHKSVEAPTVKPDEGRNGDDLGIGAPCRNAGH